MLDRTSRRGPKLLVADDDLSVLKLVADRCAAVGFNVITATTGVQAVIMAKRCQPDVVIIDVNMPEVDGLSVCARVREQQHQPAVMIVVTGSRDPATIERCEDLGVYYAKKGVDFWRSIAIALAPEYPDMAERLDDLDQPADAPVAKRPRVLLIDDDPEVETFLTSRLAKFGVDTLYAADGAEGYRVACREHPTAIISDYFMPKGNVTYLMWRLRSTSSTRNIPVFVLSGKRLDDTAVRDLKREVCGRPGAANVFRKSFDIDALLGALQKVCGFEPRRAGTVASTSAS